MTQKRLSMRKVKEILRLKWELGLSNPAITKKQQIVINPTKISGLCGRLMCCLAFEDESLGRMYAEEEKVEED